MTELAKQLKERNISQNKLAAVAGCSKQFVSSVLQGRRQPTSKIYEAVEILTSTKVNTQEGKQMPKVNQEAPKVNQPPVMVIDKRLEIQPAHELVDPAFVQISTALTEDIRDDIAEEHEEILRLRELISTHSPDVPEVCLLKLGPRRFLVLRGSTAVKAYKVYGTMPALTYRAHDVDLPFIAGLQ